MRSACFQKTIFENKPTFFVFIFKIFFFIFHLSLCFPLLFIFEKYQGRNVSDPDFMRDVIETFINKIYVYDDKIRLLFNFSDDKEAEITLTDIEKAAAGAASPVFDYCRVASTTSRKVEHLEVFFIKPLVFGVTMQI